MSITSFQLSINNATWIDCNSDFTLNSLPDIIPDDLAIANSLSNLFQCPIGARGRTFQPTYGSLWLQFLQEPIDGVTAQAMWAAMIQAISKWEPRVQLDYTNTKVTPDLTIPGYRVVITGTNLVTKTPITVQFTETAS